MQASNNQINNENSHGARPSLGKALITPQVLRMWLESARQDMHSAERATDQHYYEGQMFAYKHILEVLESGKYC